MRQMKLAFFSYHSTYTMRFTHLGSWRSRVQIESRETSAQPDRLSGLATIASHSFGGFHLVRLALQPVLLSVLERRDHGLAV